MQSFATISDHVRYVIDELEESEKEKAPPLMWKWKGSRYLGAAHGVGESHSTADGVRGRPDRV